MLRKIGFALLCTAASFSTNVYSANHMLQSGITVEYELPPNQPQVFINYMFWTVEANCKITTADENDDLFAEGIAKTGRINGVVLSEGQTLRMRVYPEEILKLNADAGAKVRITNEGKSSVRLTCVA